MISCRNSSERVLHVNQSSDIHLTAQLIENGIKSGDLTTVYLDAGKVKTKISFPTIDSKLNTRFIVYFKLLKLISSQIQSGELISKRQLYYLDVKLFRSQSVVDDAVDKICQCLNQTLNDLCILPSQKGLIHGNLTMCFNNKVYTINGTALIPSIPLSINEINVDINIATIKQIIVLEKDAILSGLVNSTASYKLEQTLLITGKGFPDRLTKHFVFLITRKFPEIPIYGYFDSDVYGFMIASEYLNRQYIGGEPCGKGMLFKGAKLLSSTSNFLSLTSKDITMSMSQISSIYNSCVCELQRSMFLCVKRELELSDIADDLK